MRHNVPDEGEPINLFEPLVGCQGSEYCGALNDLVLELAEKSAAFRSSLPETMVGAVSSLVRSMNCHYSNLIEGHDTHPIDIERAMQDNYGADPPKRNLQLEAQAWIDGDGMPDAPTAPSSIKELHLRFCGLLLADLLSVNNPDTGEKTKVIPGEFRKRYVRVGRHAASAPAACLVFWIEGTRPTACAHHRLL